jgi:putative ABC transport system substrate-binding protein
MRRREFITFVGSAVAWPLAARAQKAEQVRRIGVLTTQSESSSEGRARVGALVQRLTELGWVEGRNARLEIRWGAGDAEGYSRYARELVALSPEVILTDASPSVAALRQATRTVPIVFVGVIDPVGAGLIKSLARPGGNITGFSAFEYAIAAKWLELLKEIAPNVTRVAVLRDSAIASGIGQFAIQAVGPIGMELSVIDLHDADAVDAAVAEFADPSGGIVVTGSPFGATHPDVIVGLAARYKLPVVYPFSRYVRVGGLISYGPDLESQFRPAADYIDRILKGEKPADLPVQTPTKYRIAINLKTAKALGLTLPETLLARAEEVIE